MRVGMCTFTLHNCRFLLKCEMDIPLLELPQIAMLVAYLILPFIIPC